MFFVYFIVVFVLFWFHTLHKNSTCYGKQNIKIHQVHIEYLCTVS